MPGEQTVMGARTAVTAPGPPGPRGTGGGTARRLSTPPAVAFGGVVKMFTPVAAGAVT